MANQKITCSEYWNMFHKFIEHVQRHKKLFNEKKNQISTKNLGDR